MKNCAVSLAIVAFIVCLSAIADAQEPIWPPANVTAWPPVDPTHQPINTAAPWLEGRCRQQFSTQANAVHQTYYNIEEISSNVNNSVEFKVLVQAAQEARILLAPQNWIGPLTPLFEISKFLAAHL